MDVNLLNFERMGTPFDIDSEYIPLWPPGQTLLVTILGINLKANFRYAAELLIRINRTKSKAVSAFENLSTRCIFPLIFPTDDANV